MGRFDDTAIVPPLYKKTNDGDSNNGNAMSLSDFFFSFFPKDLGKVIMTAYDSNLRNKNNMRDFSRAVLDIFTRFKDNAEKMQTFSKLCKRL